MQCNGNIDADLEILSVHITSLIIRTLILETHLQVSVLTSLSVHLEIMLYISILITHAHIEIAK